MVMNTVRWGILGTAQIATNVFIPALNTVDNAKFYAIASRDMRQADTFAIKHDATRAFGSYQDLLDSGEIDALYVPLPNSEHERWTLAAADRGIPVFCEKPLTDASESAERLAKHCRELNIPLMEAFVFRYHPQTRVVRTLIKEGRIGTVSQITGHMSFFFDRTQLSSNIRMDSSLGGGGLLDVVCYPVAYIRHLLDVEPLTVQAAIRYDSHSGIDTAASLLLELPNAVQGIAMGGFDDHRHRGITITGSAGTIYLPEPYHPPQESLIYLSLSDRREVISLDNGGPAFAPAITHFQDHLSAPTEAPLTGDFAAGTLRVIEAAHESARTGVRVVLG